MPLAIRFGDPEVEVSVRRHSRARRMILRVPRHGTGPTLTMPPGVSVTEARAFIRDHETWLRQQVAKAPSPLEIVDGARLPFRGGSLTVEVGACRRMGIDGELLRVPGPSPRAARQAAAVLREAARERCVEVARYLADSVRRRVGRITLRDTRSRWGSCTASGDLMFSWRLILSPDPVFDYVVAHEVAHLVEMNHSPAFWAVVRQLAPQHDVPRAWLRKHGPGLLEIDFDGEA